MSMILCKKTEGSNRFCGLPRGFSNFIGVLVKDLMVLVVPFSRWLPEIEARFVHRRLEELRLRRVRLWQFTPSLRPTIRASIERWEVHARAR